MTDRTVCYFQQESHKSVKRLVSPREGLLVQQYSLCCDLGQEDLTLMGSESCCAVAGDRRCATSMTFSIPACFPYVLNSVFWRKDGIYHEFGQCSAFLLAEVSAAYCNINNAAQKGRNWSLILKICSST